MESSDPEETRIRVEAPSSPGVPRKFFVLLFLGFFAAAGSLFLAFLSLIQ